MVVRVFCLALPALLCSSTLWAAELKVKSKGEIGTETRFFVKDDNNPLSEEINAALVGRIQLDAKLKPFKLVARGFARYDPTDVDRSAAFVEDTYLEWKDNPVRLRVGAMLLNWTATEAFHPVDIINSRYLDSNLENQEKLGEPMVAFRLKFLNGNVEVMWMPFVVNPIFPSGASRQNFAPAGIELGRVLRLQRNGELLERWDVTYQFAARVQQTIGDADVSLHVVSHVDRTSPQVLILADGTPAAVFQPVIQYGGTYAHVIESLIAKLEFAYRHYARPNGGVTSEGVIADRPNYGLLAFGFEYLFPHENGSDSTLLVEGQTVFGVEGEGAFGTPSGDVGLTLPLFQRDLLVGYRYAFNDEAGREILLTFIIDVEDPEEFIANARYSQRLGETFGMVAGVRLIRVPPEGPGPAVGFAALNDDHQLYFNLTRYF